MSGPNVSANLFIALACKPHARREPAASASWQQKRGALPGVRGSRQERQGGQGAALCQAVPVLSSSTAMMTLELQAALPLRLTVILQRHRQCLQTALPRSLTIILQRHRTRLAGSGMMWIDTATRKRLALLSHAACSAKSLHSAMQRGHVHPYWAGLDHINRFRRDDAKHVFVICGAFNNTCAFV